MHSKILQVASLILLSQSFNIKSVLAISLPSLEINPRAGNPTVLDDGTGAPPGKKYNQGKTDAGWVWQSTGKQYLFLSAEMKKAFTSSYLYARRFDPWMYG